MKIYFLRNVFVLFLLVPIGVKAQTEYGETLISRLYAGGNFGLGFGTLTSIDVSPMIGYNINRHFSGGVGITHIGIIQASLNGLRFTVEESSAALFLCLTCCPTSFFTVKLKA
jgi:long-subunit fatty acid transport protein